MALVSWRTYGNVFYVDRRIRAQSMRTVLPSSRVQKDLLPMLLNSTIVSRLLEHQRLTEHVRNVACRLFPGVWWFDTLTVYRLPNLSSDTT